MFVCPCYNHFVDLICFPFMKWTMNGAASPVLSLLGPTSFYHYFINLHKWSFLSRNKWSFVRLYKYLLYKIIDHILYYTIILYDIISNNYIINKLYYIYLSNIKLLYICLYYIIFGLVKFKPDSIRINHLSFKINLLEQ